MELRSKFVLAAALALVVAAACGKDDKGDADKAGGTAAGTGESAPAGPEAEAEAKPQAPTAGGPFDPAALCDALNAEAIAGLPEIGASVENTRSTDRTMMDDVSGHCQIAVGTNKTIEIQVYDGADQRFVVNKGGGDKQPLLEQPNARPLDGLGDRAAVLWAGPDTDAKANNIRTLVVAFGDVAVQVGFRGFDPVRTPDRFVAVARKVQSDLKL
jgi:hypothetical protein